MFQNLINWGANLMSTFNEALDYYMNQSLSKDGKFLFKDEAGKVTRMPYWLAKQAAIDEWRKTSAREVQAYGEAEDGASGDLCSLIHQNISPDAVLCREVDEANQEEMLIFNDTLEKVFELCEGDEDRVKYICALVRGEGLDQYLSEKMQKFISDHIGDVHPEDNTKVSYDKVCGFKSRTFVGADGNTYVKGSSNVLAACASYMKRQVKEKLAA